MMREIHSRSLSFGLAFCAALLAPVLLGKSITSLRAAPGQPSSTYRPTLITFGIGVSLAGSAK
jgi:hypothetical protein